MLHTKKAKKDAIIGYAWEGWRDETASEKLSELITMWCTSFSFRNPLPKPPMIHVKVQYRDFKRYKLYDDDKFVFSVEYYGEIIGKQLASWRAKMDTVAGCANTIDCKRKFAADVASILENEYENPTKSLFYRDTKTILAASGVDGQPRWTYNDIKKKLDAYGVYKMCSIPKFVPVSVTNDDALFEKYPMLKFVLSAPELRNNTNLEVVELVANYVAERDGLKKK
jgi:hypothetical protein